MAWLLYALVAYADFASVPDKPYTKQRLLIGTHTSNGTQNYLQIASVQLPKPRKADVKDYDETSGEIGGYGGGPSKQEQIEVKFNITQKIDHPGEVNRARYQPQNPDIIATQCADGRVLIWNRSAHPSVPTGQVRPEIELQGHTNEGYGLSWSPHKATEGHLATGSSDKTVKLWDITKATKTNSLLKAERTYTHHTAVVNDVQYHPVHDRLIGTVSDDLTLQILDTRQASDTQSAITSGRGQHEDAINTLAFSPSADVTVATGSADKTIAIWDLRNLAYKIHVLEGHNESVQSLEWNPFEQSVLGSSGTDRRVIFWDLARIGEEQAPEDSEDGPPELLFIHGGHTNRISDFSWNKHDPWTVCSAADDNLIQIWKVAEAIVGDDEEDVPMGELET